MEVASFQLRSQCWVGCHCMACAANKRHQPLNHWQATMVACWWQPPTLTLTATIIKEEMSLTVIIVDKGARGAAIDAYKRGMILESKMRESVRDCETCRETKRESEGLQW